MTLYCSLPDPVKCTRAQKLKTPERLEHLVILPLLSCTTQYTELNSHRRCLRYTLPGKNNLYQSEPLL